MLILLTGGTGFVGSAVARYLLAKHGCKLILPVRRSLAESMSCQILVGEINGNTDWSATMANVEVVIHCAARVHVMRETHTDPLTAFRSTNVEGTLHLARAAAAAGAKRFIFLSSVKVYGEESAPDNPFQVDDTLAPSDAYGISKLEAEQALQVLATQTGMEVVIIRPPLVYGRGVKGNFASMIRLVKRGLPLPLGAIHNKRSLVGIDNLVDLIVRCLDHPAAANQILLASDGEDLSTTELLRSVAKAMGKPLRLLPIPARMLQLGASVLGKQAMAQRLLGSLQMDISQTCALLEWVPPYTVEEELRRCFEPPRRSATR